MIDIYSWLDAFVESMSNSFGSRVVCIGLQGSYGRGEATEESDLDVVVIFDRLTCDDIETYRALLDQMPEREKLCGFISGKEELERWEPADLFQFYFDTTPVHGSLDFLKTQISREAVRRAVRIGAGNIYHGCVHNMLHEKSEELLRELYKSAAFVVQAVHYLHSGVYVKRHKELQRILTGREKEIMDVYMALRQGEDAAFAPMSELLFQWSQERLILCKEVSQ